MTKQSAKQAYEAKMKQIEKRMAEIRRQLDQHIEPGDETSWGHVGDLGYVEEQLHIIEAFLKNEDIDD